MSCTVQATNFRPTRSAFLHTLALDLVTRCKNKTKRMVHCLDKSFCCFSRVFCLFFVLFLFSFGGLSLSFHIIRRLIET